MLILIHASKDDQVWGIGHKGPDQILHATPARPDHKTMYIYNDRESQNIWLCASHIQDAK